MDIKQELMCLLREGNATDFNRISDFWRKTNETGYLDLRGITVVGQDVNGFNFSRCNLGNSDFESASLVLCIFIDVKGLAKVNFFGTYFELRSEDVDDQAALDIFRAQSCTRD